MLTLALSVVCLLWMHKVVQDMLQKKYPEDMRKIEA